jgi:eukaryotic-like serine/threonine-protein kinase
MPGRLHIWDIAGSPGHSELRARESDQRFLPLEGILSLALRHDGAVLAVGDRTGNVSLIDTARRTLMGSIRPSDDETESFGLSLAFSPDGQNLAVGSQDGVICLYSVDSPSQPRLRFRLPGHRGRLSNLVFDSQGKRLACIAGADPLVEVWDLDLIRRELARLDLADTR